jgi:hypothetical protein
MPEEMSPVSWFILGVLFPSPRLPAENYLRVLRLMLPLG